ncbi:FISUMP domain-containing protein [Psychroflexus planctonicus]|uniref:Fibrobacter succinogenes major paralogous domain-containing protein n=1 Tax=Psychroflexus planctonicus TaxID=1526575 RepID=A0ABQ1SC11_9FLAO|nr:FISUMP domain-containing protein [Psychroflexus planctonicus]GGE26650.1 hypothetical protein GCM10010832_04190 [Psychroflexus planctonicus]
MNKKNKLLSLVLILISLSALQAQVGIGTTNPDASAGLDVNFNDKGFLPPRLTTAQRDDNIVNPAEGLTIYNTDQKCLQWYDGAKWYDGCNGYIPGALSDCSTPGFIPPFLTADETMVKDVTNPNTGKTWMDRNLGAYNKARSSTDCWAYGNLYQWGRNSDGHESRLLDCTTGDCFDAGQDNATLPATAADVTDPTFAGKFIYNTDFPYDWHQDNPDNTLWTSAGGTNNPCPDGYRVPTEAEWQAESDDGSWSNATDAFNSDLALTLAGRRLEYYGGVFDGVGNYGFHWTITVNPFGNYYRITTFGDTFFAGSWVQRATAGSVRCIKN